ncbi:MAG: 50S ribosomal protein L1 [Candidatus Marinimicrobia bacterium]|jgi:large subunit ribosomal protein L1|nr:50S ribosomal protein L1 [Candidatus Neomarinimicrobiota bacterium]MBT3945810.1 50S ribosomal protein L1 [Candidatus Neomarinimicrobiota bacterium]MBT4155486.1 50S ribosomal protein L1 [Candidatus Neomarinimicrobiota bacterium]MBT4555276.1 50S ribosomal protein L1 [Candidatus Neomarinimicrobiota bacterium]MBT4752895.1 50S ribosomal protein L1 [Candidatus Neomarinimicrobiota bacterium]|tara:strand:- start:12090 stop:12779 length:690 start_codon:yes stop_codon:yes gene_type:complete
MSLSKNMKSATSSYDKMVSYSLKDAMDMVQEYKFTKFDESVDLAINLDVDPRHAEENIRVTTPLPHGTGKSVSVLVLTQGAKEKEAQDAGADFVGNKDYLTKIKNGWTEVDKIVATPDMMGELGKLGKILGPKGLMPNPKSGTVTMDVAKAVKDLKAGQVELRVEKTGIIHVSCGKVSFGVEKLTENIQTVYDTVMKVRPASVKGQYLEKMSVSSTMGPGIQIDHTSIR